MHCEVCQQNPATVHVKQVVNGVSREMHVCEDCARKQGIDVGNVPALTELLLGMGAGGAAAAPQPTEREARKVCPACHMRLGDFRKASRLGCSECYAAFASELEPLIAGMQRATRHLGKVPASARADAERASLARALAEAVADQRFEEAAELRDRLRALSAATVAPVERPADAAPDGGEVAP